MPRTIKVNYKNLETKEFLTGTSLKKISESFSKYYNYPILIGKVDNNMTELNEPITRSCSIDFYDRSSGVGNSIYGRTAQFLLIVAIKKVLGNDTEVIIENSIDKGFYAKITNEKINKTIIKKIEEKMKEISKTDYIINKVSVSRFDAIKFFKKKKQEDKVKVLKYISNSYINLYRIDDIYDYFYGDLAYSTGQIDDFKLTYIKGEGFVLSYPDTYNPECTLDYVHHEKLFNSFDNFAKWCQTIGISNAADLNEIISQGKYNELIRLSETYYNNQLSNIAEKIYNNKNNHIYRQYDIN